MANVPESAVYDAGVYQIEIGDPVQGGAAGLSNTPLKNLANRTAYLKVHVDQLESGTTIPPTVAPKDSPVFTGDPRVPTPALGDADSSIANTLFLQNTVNGVLQKNVAGGVNVVLTAVEAGSGIYVLSGALTANIAVIVPNTAKKLWIVNNTTGAFALTVKTAAGTGLTVAQGKTRLLLCDGTNVIDALTDFTVQATEAAMGAALVATQAKTDAGVVDTDMITPKKLRWGFSAVFGTNGYITFPSWLGGFIIQWGTASTSATAAVAVSFPITFPTGAYGVALATSSIGTGVFVTYNSIAVGGFNMEGWSATSTRALMTVSYITVGK